MQTTRSGTRRGSCGTAWLLGGGLLLLPMMASAVETSDPPPVPIPAESPATDPADPTTPAADHDTTLAALQLLNDAVTVQADGKHNRLLRALRHLEDPTLGPLFAGLSRAAHPSLRVHGLLGVAELNQPRGLTTAQIAAVDRSEVQAELISAALDGELIDRPTRVALLGWHGLDPGVKILLATPLVAAGEFDTASPAFDDLVDALDDETLGRRGLAALLLHELGDDRGTRALEALTLDTHPTADAVRATLLETAWTHGLTASAGWAFDVADSPRVPPRVEMLALKVAIRFGDARADDYWAQQFAAREDVSEKTRLAWLGLEAAPWLSAERFDLLAEADDALIAQLGRTARSVSLTRAGKVEHPAVDAHVIQLIKTGHPQACQWAADYARQIGSAELAAAVVMHTDPGEPRGRARRLDAVVSATQTLIALNPASAERLLSAALGAENADPGWQRGVLLGLIRSRSDAARNTVAKLPEAADLSTEALALVLRLQDPDPLTEEQYESLSLVVRGGVDLDDSLRVQAAWAYLERTGQGPEAIAAVLAEP